MARRLDRINAFLDGAKRARREIETPEGVTLEIEIANIGERALALSLDLFFTVMALLLLLLALAALIYSHMNGAVTTTLVLFLAFLVRNLYFIHFELTTQGSTPGKRIVGLRVIDRLGGPLTASAIVARNLTREIETFLPLGLIFSLPANGGGDFWTRVAYLGWLGVVSALPFFNAAHRRAGDLIGGTLVIAAPKQRLLEELGTALNRYSFTRRQLEAYGAFELQVLEEILRRPASAETAAMLRDVCAKICRKIEWVGAAPVDDARAFLREFYVAERAHLEREQTFGKYRADKLSPPANAP